jgi:hypothetical protein
MALRERRCESRRWDALQRLSKLIFLLIVSWCIMTVTHEAGHVICGWLGGARLRSADLRPWHLPYSLFDPDPHPLLTLWGGPLLGVLLPTAIALSIRQNWSWFIACFCLLANGLYLAMAWMVGERELDTAKLLAHGASPLTLAVYCFLTIGVGYWGFRRQCIKVLWPLASNVRTNSPTS